jgi:hypothetical protein
VRESQEELIAKLEGKLREDAQTLISNKSLIEYLNKSLNEAQKYSFKAMVNQKQVVGGGEPNTIRGGVVRPSSRSPLRVS